MASKVRNRVIPCLPTQPGLEDRIRQAARYAAAHNARFVAATVRTGRLSEQDRLTLRWLCDPDAPVPCDGQPDRDP